MRLVHGVVELALRAYRFVSAMQRPLRVLYACLVLTNYAYFISVAVLVQTLTSNARFSDVQAGMVYSAYGLLVSIYGVLMGFIVDHVGVFACIVVGATSGACGRAMLAWVFARGDPTREPLDLALALIMLATLVPASDALIGQVIGLGIKRYTGRKLDATASFDDVQLEETSGSKRSTEYALSYALGNVAAMLAFSTIALLNTIYPTHEPSVNQGALIAAFIPLVAAVAVGWYGRRIDTYNVNLTLAYRANQAAAEETLQRIDELSDDADDRFGVLPRAVRASATGPCRRCRECIRCIPRPFVRWIRTLFTSSNAILLRYVVMVLLLVPVKTLFRHMDATLPKYTQREFDPNFSYALLLLINPLLCIVLAVPLGAALERFDDYRVITVGTGLCVLATALAMIPTVPTLVLFILVFSVGEIIWSPRLQTYFYSLAPKGEEGAFGALAAVPLFLAKMPVGVFSGKLLDDWCPMYGNCNGAALWGLIGVSAAISPLALLTLGRWIARGIGANSNNGHHHIRTVVIDTDHNGDDSVNGLDDDSDAASDSDATDYRRNQTTTRARKQSVQLDMLTPRATRNMPMAPTGSLPHR